MIFPEPIVLHDELLLAQGSSRSIFRHPQNSEWLIKVLRPQYIERKSGSKAPWYKRLRRLGSFVGFEREFQEQLAAYLHYGAHPSCLQFVVGLQPTNLGLGQIVEAVRGRDGQYAPTLRTLVRTGRYDEQAEQELQRIFDWLLESPIVISDMTLDNLVYRYTSSTGEHFCIIDGIGEPNLIPLKSSFQWWNRLSKQRWVAKIKQRVILEQALD
jgi:hypothetical protein